MTDSRTGSILVIGGSGLVGRRLVERLLAEGHRVRCLARTAARVADLADAGCEIVLGDIIDAETVRKAAIGTTAVFIAIHTLSPQPASAKGANFMDIEAAGIANVIAAGRGSGPRRVIYVTSLGIAPDAPSDWLRGRWGIEQALIDSCLSATVIKPGHIVGVGGQGFDTVIAQARRRFAVTFAGDRPLFRTIALDDLVDDMIGLLDEPAAYGRRLDVGSDDILSINAMIDIVAETLGRAPPIKLKIPRAMLRMLAPLAGKLTGLPDGAFAGFVEALAVDSVGDPTPIRTMLPGLRLGFRASVDRALGSAKHREPSGLRAGSRAKIVAIPTRSSKPIDPKQEIME